MGSGLIAFPGLMYVSLGLSQSLFFFPPPGYLAFHIASEQHSVLVKRD